MLFPISGTRLFRAVGFYFLYRYDNYTQIKAKCSKYRIGSTWLMFK